MTGGSIAEVRGLTISYRAGSDRVTVVDDVSFSLARGRTLGLVGESGSGKSTLARTLLGHLRDGSRVDAGTVEVSGGDVFSSTPEDLRRLRGGEVSLVAQNAGHALTPSMRIGAQVAEALRVHGLPSGGRRVRELLELVRLPEPDRIARRYPHELSGGQQQRVAIAMAVSTEPKVLVLDEPTTALDVITQAAVLRLVDDLRDRLGMAVLIVSHDLGVVSALADDVLVLRHGRVVEQAPTARILTAPEADYTRALLAAAPRLDAELVPREKAGDDVVLRCHDVDVRYPGQSRRAVAGFGVEMRRGETVGIVGESGSGKSTVAAALAGLIDAEAGTASLRIDDGAVHDLLGRARSRPAVVRRAVQLIFQNADLALNPRRTVGDAVARPLAVFGRASGRAARRARVAELFDEVGLDPAMARRVPAQLSGGQRQRIGIARALAAEPSVLIADEITTALDVSVQAEVLALLERLRRTRDLACLFISHDLAVVRGVADRIVVMRHGVVVESAPSARLFEDPRHPYTRALLAAAVEPGRTGLPLREDEYRDAPPDPSAPMVEVATGHLVRETEGSPL
ncbi:ABC transporter ATP-binding protein [Microbacterium marinilacus]|uniref:ABC transporter ATP-binding protein n=1 Tax=Microbacterium marinilacus TaxID=415209 RepID=A0ABP7BTM4_9MICO|nr:ABC transporter ATP-binding protein [Microbacterium marinilacus]MBY0689075.1 ABC transporter ATP-binding protein [Microbacterium marinilacus]